MKLFWIFSATIPKLKPPRRFNSFLVRKRLKSQCKLQGQHHQIQIKQLTSLDLLALGKDIFFSQATLDYLIIVHWGVEIKFKRHFIPAEILGFPTFTKWHISILKMLKKVDLNDWSFQKSGFSNQSLHRIEFLMNFIWIRCISESRRKFFTKMIKHRAFVNPINVQYYRIRRTGQDFSWK